MKILIEKRKLVEMASTLISEPCEFISDCDVPLEMIIFINDSERNHDPHVHVQVRPQCQRGTNSAPIFETCIRIDSAEYSLHSSKFKKFPTTAWRDLFVKLMSGYTCLEDCDVSVKVWNYTKNQWNRSMSANRWVPRECTMPDYSCLEVDTSGLVAVSQKIDEIVSADKTEEA